MNIDLKMLQKYNIKAKKSLGQNFLVNNEIVKNIANIIDIKGKNIVEIGPGYGALTEELLKQKPKSLNLIEIDDNMINVLNLRLKNGDFDVDGIDFKINKIDVLEYSPIFPPCGGEQGGVLSDYFVIANIPYYITSPILKHFLYEIEYKPKKMLILMQKDVGDRITLTPNPSPIKQLEERKIAKHKKGKSSVLSLFVQKKYFVKEVLFVGKENFVPSPKIESSVLLFEFHDLYENTPDEPFLEFIKKGFKEPRKKLIKNLVNNGYEKEKVLKIFRSLGIDENIRGEDLGIEVWCELLVGISLV